MKKIKIILIITALFVAINTYAQVPPPPPPNHGNSGNQSGGNAPIASGLFILLSLGAAYGGKKVYDLKQKKLED